MAGQTIQISVLADTKKFSSAMRKLGDETGLSKLATGAKKVGTALVVAGAAAATAAVALGVKAVGAASDLEQSIGGVDAIFKDNADTIHKWAADAAGNLGLSRNSYNELAGIIGTTLKNSGTSMDELAGKTDQMIGIAADLSATFGGTVVDSSNAMASALRGEFEPLRRYGVSLSQADINAKALAMSGKDSADQLTKQEKALATQALILEQSADAQGAFARESNTLAGQTERLKAKFENILATLGTYLLPVLTAVAAWVSDRLEPAFESLTAWIESTGVPALKELAGWFQDNVVPALQRVGEYLTGTVVPALQSLGEYLTGTVVPALADFGRWIQDNADWLIPLVGAIGAMVLAYQTYVKVMAIWKAAVAVATAVQVALNVAMTANPIGIVVLAIVGLIAGIVLLYQKNEAFRTLVQKVWEALKTFFAAAVEWIKNALAKLAEVPGNIAKWFTDAKTKAVQIFTAMVDWVKGLPGRVISALVSLGAKLYTAAQTHVERFKAAAVAKFENVVAWVKGLPGKVLSALGDLGALLKSAGRKVIQGFLDGITGAFDRVKRTLSNLTDLLPDWKGPAARDRTILTDAGALIIEGFVDGLESRYGAVKRSLGDLTGMVAETTMPDLAAPGLGTTARPALGRGRPGQGGDTINVTVQALTPTPEVGRVVVSAIDQYQRRNGRR